jgi:hypothetical protein
MFRDYFDLYIHKAMGRNHHVAGFDTFISKKEPPIEHRIACPNVRQREYTDSKPVHQNP